MFCSGCQKVKTIPSCSTDANLGTLAVLNTACLAIFAIESSGREWYVPFTSGAAGQAIVDLSGKAWLTENYRYSVKIIQGSNLNNYTNELSITVGGTAYTCLYMDFSNVTSDATGEITGATSISVEADT